MTQVIFFFTGHPPDRTREAGHTPEKGTETKPPKKPSPQTNL